jgi:hypothetical protein
MADGCYDLEGDVETDFQLDDDDHDHGGVDCPHQTCLRCAISIPCLAMSKVRIYSKRHYFERLRVRAYPTTDYDD